MKWRRVPKKTMTLGVHSENGRPSVTRVLRALKMAASPQSRFALHPRSETPRTQLVNPGNPASCQSFPPGDFQRTNRVLLSDALQKGGDTWRMKRRNGFGNGLAPNVPRRRLRRCTPLGDSLDDAADMMNSFELWGVHWDPLREAQPAYRRRNDPTQGR